MGNRRGVAMNWLPTFLVGTTEFNLSSYQPKTVPTTLYLVELMGDSGGFS